MSHIALLKGSDGLDRDPVYQDAYHPGEVGVISKNGVFFHYPTPFAKNHLFYVLWGDEYVCVKPYRVHRKYLNCFILFRILDGEMHFEYREKRFTAHAGDVVLLDCKWVNHYWTEKRVRFLYFHFDGNITQEYCDMLYKQSGAIFHDKPQLSFLFNYIFSELMSGQANDHKLSFLIHNILGILALSNEKSLSQSIYDAQQYILNNFQEALTVDEIAEQAGLSKYHFSRIFKDETGYSPHQYLFSVRLRHAIDLLSGTQESVERIAEQCGFSSTSHFIRAFKKETEVTPQLFRRFFDPTGFKQ